jgi:hypothetical protein
VIVKNNKATNIDITIPFENKIDALTDARQQKINIYAALVRNLNTRFNEVKVDAIVLGSLGTWDQENDRLMKTKCLRKYSRNFVCRTSLDIHGTSIPSTSPESESNEQVF